MRSCLWIATVALLLFSTTVAAIGAAPAERGPYAIAALSESLRDADRGRTIDFLVLYPAPGQAPALPAAPFPLIVFNHGFLLNGSAYRSYGEHLVSHGFVVALPTCPMSLFDLNHTTLAQDVRFVIDRCLALSETEGHALHGLVDPDGIGLSGHSLGGKLALLEAASDDRVRAAALLDPVDGGGPVAPDPVRYPSVAPELMPQIRIPLLFVGAELGGEVVVFTACAPREENYQRFFEAANPPAIEVTQIEVGHAQYLDPGANALAVASCAQGDVPGEWVRSVSAAYLTALFLGTLKGDVAALVWLDERLAGDEAAGRIRVRRK